VPISTLYAQLPTSISTAASDNDTTFTITITTNLIFDTSPTDIDTAAAYACMQSIDNEQLSFCPTGILTLTSGVFFVGPYGPVTMNSTVATTSTLALPSSTLPASTSGLDGLPFVPYFWRFTDMYTAGECFCGSSVRSGMVEQVCKLSADCPKAFCSAGQSPICAPSRQCLCGSSSLSLGPLIKKALPTWRFFCSENVLLLVTRAYFHIRTLHNPKTGILTC
jgi:hypothetical protein